MVMVLTLGGFQKDHCGRSASWGAAGGPAGRPCVLRPLFSLPGLLCLCGHTLSPRLPLCPSSPFLLPLGSASAPLLCTPCPPPPSLPPSISPPDPPPPVLFTLHHPAMHHSVPAIRLPFHLCLLPLRGGCDPRNISEGEEGVSRSGAERDRLGRLSERGSLLQPGRGGGLVRLSGPRFKSCLSLTAAG